MVIIKIIYIQEATHRSGFFIGGIAFYRLRNKEWPSLYLLTGCSVVVARLSWEQEVAGSSPAIRIYSNLLSSL